MEAVSSQGPCMFLLSGATVEEADGRTGSQLDIGAKTNPQISG